MDVGWLSERPNHYQKLRTFSSISYYPEMGEGLEMELIIDWVSMWKAWWVNMSASRWVNTSAYRVGGTP